MKNFFRLDLAIIEKELTTIKSRIEKGFIKKDVSFLTSFFYEPFIALL